MSLAASAYSVGLARNNQKYWLDLLKTEGFSTQKLAKIGADFCKKERGSVFSDRPGPSQLTSLLQKFGRKVPKK